MRATRRRALSIVGCTYDRVVARAMEKSSKRARTPIAERVPLPLYPPILSVIPPVPPSVPIGSSSSTTTNTKDGDDDGGDARDAKRFKPSHVAIIVNNAQSSSANDANATHQTVATAPGVRALAIEGDGNRAELMQATVDRIERAFRASAAKRSPNQHDSTLTALPPLPPPMPRFARSAARHGRVLVTWNSANGGTFARLATADECSFISGCIRRNGLTPVGMLPKQCARKTS
jgi:hypothetical protein